MACREAERRRPEWAGGTPLLLPSGETWWFYEPMPVVVEVEGVKAVAWDWGVITDEETFLFNDTLYRVLGKLARAGTDKERVGATVELAWIHLFRNYEISPQEFEEVLMTRRISAGLWGRIEGFALALVDVAKAFQAAHAEPANTDKVAG